MNKINVKRIYDPPSDDDGYRMLVDRLWPRGIKKEDAMLDEWNKSIAPSAELRKWFAHRAERFKLFENRYRAELLKNIAEVTRIKALAQKQSITLLYAAKDTMINHAIILKKYIENS